MKSSINKSKRDSNSSAEEIIIPIMGPTGAGKSTFVNTLLQTTVADVGHQLTSCTTNLLPVEVPLQGIDVPDYLKGYRFTVVDTPGFDDTHERDAEILYLIANWLKAAYLRNSHLGGVIYLHDISLKRFTGTARRNLSLFNLMCGDEALKNVVLAMTNWPSNSASYEGHNNPFINRENEFKTEHWRDMIDKGSQVTRFINTQASALDLINLTIRQIDLQKMQNKAAVMLEIQSELALQRKIVPETKAGRELRYTLEELLAMQKKLVNLEGEIARGDPGAKENLEALKAKMYNFLSQVKQLKVPLTRRLRKYPDFDDTSVND